MPQTINPLNEDRPTDMQ